MRISQKLEYASRAMLQLAKHADGHTITRLDEIAQREDVSSNFLVQILNDLRNADVIQSKRGKFGGYLLARAPEDITLFDIVSAVEPAMVSTPSPQDGESAAAVSKGWENVSNHLNKYLKETTLASLIADESGPMFYI